MSQINRYNIQKVSEGTLEQNLSSQDEALVPSYSLGPVPFLVGKHQIDVSFYTLDGIFLETSENIKTYSILGVNQGEDVTEVSVFPVQDALDHGYLGDVQVEYRVTDNMFSPSQDKDPEGILFIREISSDRTEIRATSTTLTEDQMQSFAQNLYRELNLAAYFKGVYLKFEEGLEAWCINVMTEVLDGKLLVTFKTYEPLPDTVVPKSRFRVLKQIGGTARFEVTRTVEILEEEDTSLRLRGPNFDIETTSADLGVVTDYLNFKELFSYPENLKSLNLYSVLKEQGIELGIDHSDFANFIHFSSAAERLENFRYKLGLIQGYEKELELEKPEAEKNQIRDLIQGIIDNFDHYDRYLYFEKTDTAWPKMATERPYINLSLTDANSWFQERLRVAQEYDSNNPDALVKTVPQAIRSDERNEPYLIFVHMIGQQFDDEWIYAKAVSKRYNGDNRLNFGLSKDLVRDALKSFGVELETTNQNLSRFFDACVPGEAYRTGSETSVNTLMTITAGTSNEYDGEYVEPLARHSVPDLDGGYAVPYIAATGRRVIYSPEGEIIGYVTGSDGEVLGQLIDAGYSLKAWPDSTEFQPILEDDYRKEIYKRIFHNIPLLLKTKGTSRGLRALITCFGIPEDLLEISVTGGAKLDQLGPFFGPEYRTTSSLDRIRTDNTGSAAALLFDETTGIFISGTVLSLDRQIQQPGQDYQRGTNTVEVGFRLNAQLDKQVKDYLISSSSEFDYDNLIGDPRNTEENYGKAFTLLRNQVLPELWGDQGILPLRTPTAILRLIRYYDSVLFRTLQSFVPARDVVSTGAIIDDNILHRNKYKGVDPKAQDLKEVTGSIETVYIDGGEAGCLKVLRGGRPAGKSPQTASFVIKATSVRNVTESRECPTVDYIEDSKISVGSKFVPKTVFDDSPRYTGELAGTDYEVTNGELNEQNIYKRGGSSSKTITYALDYRFLCLPRFPIDTILDAVGIIEGNYIPINTSLLGTEYSTTATVLGKPVQKIVTTNLASKKTSLEINCPRDKFQGCLFKTVQSTPDKYVNYLGLDPDLRWAGEDLGRYKDLELLKVHSGSPTFLLLPSDPANLGTGGVLNNEIYKDDLWNGFLQSSYREIYPRVVENSSGPVLSLRIREAGWKKVLTPQVRTVSLEDIGILELYTLFVGNERTIFEKLKDLNPGLNNNSLSKIYLYINELNDFNPFVVIDFDDGDGKVKIWEVESDSYWENWAVLKGYGGDVNGWNSPEDVKNYLNTRYAPQAESKGLVVMGVEVRDYTGKIITTGGSSLVLIESYMGTPYIFSQGTGTGGVGKFQMLLENWI